MNFEILLIELNFIWLKSKEVKYALVGAGCYMYYFNWNNKIWCVDATQPNGRFGRLINHSRKSPNCKTKLIEFNGRPHLVFIALRDINKNEEILRTPLSRELWCFPRQPRCQLSSERHTHYLPGTARPICHPERSRGTCSSPSRSPCKPEPP